MLKKISSGFKLNDKKRILILLKTLDQIQNDNKETKSCIEKSIKTICKEEAISIDNRNKCFCYLIIISN